MSSHHVVREAQEPALVILHPHALSHAQITPLLEWSPTIIVAAEALAGVLEHQIKVDGVVFCRDEKEEISGMVREQEPISLIASHEQENTLSAALNYLKSQGHSAVNILCSPVLSQQEEQKRLLATQALSFNLVLLDGKSKSALCRPGKYVKWYPAGERISIQPALEEVIISTRGLNQDLRETLIKKRITTQTAASGVISISGDSLYWIMEEL